MIAIYRNRFIERLITTKKVNISKKDKIVFFKCVELNCIFSCSYSGTCKNLFDRKPNLPLEEAQKYIDEYPEYLI